MFDLYIYFFILIYLLYNLILNFLVIVLIKENFFSMNLGIDKLIVHAFLKVYIKEFSFFH